MKPPPFLDEALSYVTLEMEKIGVKNTRKLFSPFVRVAIRGKRTYGVALGGERI